MQFLSLQFPDILALVCKTHQKWGIYISPSYDDAAEAIPEIQKAIPFLTVNQVGKLLIHQDAFLLFDTEQEMNTAYDQIVGDDGPTKANPYADDKARVYALTCNPDGVCLTENT